MYFLIHRLSFQKSEIARWAFAELYPIGLCGLFCLQNSILLTSQWLLWLIVKNRNLIRKLWSLGQMSYKPNALSIFHFHLHEQDRLVCHWVKKANELFEILFFMNFSGVCIVSIGFICPLIRLFMNALISFCKNPLFFFLFYSIKTLKTKTSLLKICPLKALSNFDKGSHH